MHSELPPVPLAFAARHRGHGGPLPSAVAELLTSAGVPASRVPRGGTLAWPITPELLAELLPHVLRGTEYAIALFLDRQARQLPMLAGRALDRAEHDQLGITVDATPHDPRSVPLHTSLSLTAAVMRRRTPAMWEAIDLLATARGNAERVAAALGCSGQAVRERRARAQAGATQELAALVSYVLIPPSR